MKSLTREILLRALGRRAIAADLARLPAAYRRAGGGLTSQLATAGILRLALRWPALTWILILSMVAARIMSGRRRQPDDIAPAR
jgi:hypothetical protein